MGDCLRQAFRDSPAQHHLNQAAMSPYEYRSLRPTTTLLLCTHLPCIRPHEKHCSTTISCVVKSAVLPKPLLAFGSNPLYKFIIIVLDRLVTAGCKLEKLPPVSSWDTG